MGDERPTQLLVEIKRGFAEIGIAPDNAIIKSRILSTLLPNIIAALVGHDSAAPDDYVKNADIMLKVAFVLTSRLKQGISIAIITNQMKLFTNM